jgi:opacity protein-like surface antigen
MMKKLVLLSVLVALAAGGAFALPEFKLSAGAGGYFASDFGGGIEVSPMNEETGSIKTPYFGGGGFAFFDATFAELSLGFLGGGGTTSSEIELFPEGDRSFMGLDIGLLGKYPFAINDQLSVFPALGITYRLVLSAKENGNTYKNLDEDEAPGDFSALWLNFGGGLDFAFTDHIYLRGGLVYGLRLANKAEKDLVDFFDAWYGPMSGTDLKTLGGHGLEVKIAVGYRF